VLRPFQGWRNIEERADSGNQFWQLVRNFGLVYNWSNNFDAPSGAQNDAFGKPLPNPGTRTGVYVCSKRGCRQ